MQFDLHHLFLLLRFVVMRWCFVLVIITVLLFLFEGSPLNSFYFFEILLIGDIFELGLVIEVIAIDKDGVCNLIIPHFHSYNSLFLTSKLDGIDVETKIANPGHLIKQQKHLIFITSLLKIQSLIRFDIESHQRSLKLDLILVDVIRYRFIQTNMLIRIQSLHIIIITGNIIKTGPLISSKHSDINVFIFNLRYLTALNSFYEFIIMGSKPRQSKAHLKLYKKLKGQ